MDDADRFIKEKGEYLAWLFGDEPGAGPMYEDFITSIYLQAIEDAAKVIDSIPMGYAHPPGNVTEKELANARLKYAAAIRSLKPTNEGKEQSNG